MLFNKFRLNGYFNKSRKGLDLLPKTNLISNIFMKNGELIDKIENEPPKVLYPCFKGDGSKYIDLNETIELTSGFDFTIWLKPVEETTARTALNDRYGNSYVRFRNDTLYIKIDDGAYRTKTYHIDGELHKFRFYEENEVIKCSVDDSTSTLDFNFVGREMLLKINRISGRGGIEKFNGLIYGYSDNQGNVISLIGHAYGFDTNGNPIEGTLSDDSCFTGLCEYNPQEGFNFAPDGNGNLVIPQSRIDPNKDVLGNDLVDFLGGDAIAPYCILDYELATGGVAEIMNRDNNAINNGDFNAFEEIAGEFYQWRVETLLRLPEFIRSLQDTWHVFIKKRTSDEALERMVIYKGVSENKIPNYLRTTADGNGGKINGLLIDEEKATIGVWIQPDSIKGTGNDNNIIGSLYYHDNDFSLSQSKYDNRYYFSVGVNKTFKIELPSSVIDSFNLLLITYDSSKPKDEMVNIYYNGVSIGVSRIYGEPEGIHLENINPLYISGQALFKGKIAKPFISNTIISEEEVAMLYGRGTLETAGNPLDLETKPIFYFDMNNIDETTIKDETNNGNDLTLKAGGTVMVGDFTYSFSITSKILKEMKDIETDVTDYEAYINVGRENNIGLKTGSAILNDANSVAKVGDSIGIIHDICSDRIYSGGSIAPTLEEDGNNKYYSDFTTPTSSLLLSNSISSEDYCYAQNSAGIWVSISLVNNSIIQDTDLINIDKKMYGFISSKNDIINKLNS